LPCAEKHGNRHYPHGKYVAVGLITANDDGKFLSVKICFNESNGLLTAKQFAQSEQKTHNKHLMSTENWEIDCR
jgi:hypothetical protein